MQAGMLSLGLAIGRRWRWAILVQALGLVFLPGLPASPSAWDVTGIQGTGIEGMKFAMLSPDGVTLGPVNSEIVLSCSGNGADFERGALAPNEIVSLFGDHIGPAQPVNAHADDKGIFPLQLGGSQVTFDGVAAPLLYADSGQINLVAPRSLQGKTLTHVCAVINTVQTNCLDLPVRPAAPGIFTSGLFWDPSSVGLTTGPRVP